MRPELRNAAIAAALLAVFAVLRRGRFRAFSPYLWAVSAITIVSVLLGR